MSLDLQLFNRDPDLNFRTRLPTGEIIALLGPSGCGKTSILRAIAGLLRPASAAIRMQDEVWSEPGRRRFVPTRQRAIGFVPQHYGLFPHLTALGNVMLSLHDLPPAERADRARAFLGQVQIGELADRHPRDLSGGQRQRLALARAIARRPALLLLDEPFSAVDRTTKRQLYVEIKHLNAELGLTTLLVTHDLDEAAQLASHLCLIERGRLLQAGPTHEVLGRPRCEAAARLLDIPNIFDGRFDAAAGAGSDGILWGPHRLQVRGQALQTGPLRWGIHPGNVLMVRDDKPWGDHLENPIGCRVADRVQLGADVLVWLSPDAMPHETLQMRLPARALQRHPIRPGQAMTVCLRPEDLLLFHTDAPHAAGGGPPTLRVGSSA